MFKGHRYVTQCVQNTIPLPIQNLIWYMIETMDVSEKDPLQVFEFTKVFDSGECKQKIIHSQEGPRYKAENIVTMQNPINSKIYVIDDKTHSTMLLSEEY